MDAFTLRWVEDDRNVAATTVACEEVIYHSQSAYTNIENTIIPDTDQMAAENLMYLSQDYVAYNSELVDDGGVECVTEEVITDDWVVPGGQERVEVPMEQLTQPLLDIKEDDNIDVPLPTDQDEYTAMRPYPCDFCSRRFRKKAALMNHMVAHQTDRPHACNLCGVRYVRKSDLMHHLKVHAFVPDPTEDMDYDEILDSNHVIKPKKKRGRRKKVSEPPEEEEERWENMTSARTQQWSRKRAAPPAPEPPPARSPSPPPPPADPARPFVCRTCGVGFAREKALQSHSRIHGGESPLECGACGELCWSRDALAAHARRRHPSLPPAEPAAGSAYATDDDEEYLLSPCASPPARGVRGPELFCTHCGVAFQRADLLRRHQAAAHSYKRHDSTGTEHACDVCGETCADALSLLAHAETHVTHRVKSRTKGRNSAAATNSKHFPCRECGKVFGSRSSQQIHVRIHTGERPYACRFCWKAFADGGTLRKHERIHTGEKPYACAVCPRAFNQRVVLREHVRSHHSAPERKPAGGTAYTCEVCGDTQPSSGELVQHLIQHCDENTALQRQPQTFSQSGPRRYKRRKRRDSPREWSPPPPRRRRAPPAPPPPARAKMIHTDKRSRGKQLRTRRPGRHPADDLRAIRPALSPPSAPASPASAPASPASAPSSPASAPASPAYAPASPPEVHNMKQEQSYEDDDDNDDDDASNVKLEPEEELPSPTPCETGAFRCEMCQQRYATRDDLLLHVPVHI